MLEHTQEAVRRPLHLGRLAWLPKEERVLVTATLPSPAHVFHTSPPSGGNRLSENPFLFSRVTVNSVPASTFLEV